MPDRPYDIVVFGATGFTGGLTAEYLARRTIGTRWALAGRSRAKLEQTRTHLETIEPAAANVDLIEADIGDVDSMRRVAECTKVVITTVGPYIRYGEPLVAACAEAGTDYVDLTGEPEFVDRMWLKYHARATETGARLVHSCGFDSIPHDLGVLYTVVHLPEGVPITVEGFVRGNGTFSGGTYHSTVEILSRLRQGKQAASERRGLEPRPPGRIVKGLTTLPRYGPEFRYAHYIVVKRLPTLALLGAGAATMVALAQLTPTRDLLLKFKDQGDGPSAAQRGRSWFNVRFKGEGGGRRVIAEVSGGDPGYGETSKMLAEAALCLAHDELPQTAGQVTPAVAMGHALIDRLINAGIRFATVSEDAA